MILMSLATVCFNLSLFLLHLLVFFCVFFLICFCFFFFLKDRSFLPKGAYDSGGEAFTQWDEVDQFEWQASMVSLQFRCLRMEIKISNLCFCEVGWLFFWSICMWVFIFLLFCEVAHWSFIDLHVGVRFFCCFIKWAFAFSIDLYAGVHFLPLSCYGSSLFWLIWNWELDFWTSKDFAAYLFIYFFSAVFYYLFICVFA